jgi:hypothetical protein
MSASGVFGPAPEGIILAETQNASIKAAVISLMAIGTVAVILRFIARTMHKGMKLAMDDYCIALGLVSLLFCFECATPTNHDLALCTWHCYLQSRQ